jgi:hypothetical protein
LPAEAEEPAQRGRQKITRPQPQNPEKIMCPPAVLPFGRFAVASSSRAFSRSQAPCSHGFPASGTPAPSLR